ncbi:hypothetical protein J4418_01950 [Candidatus Woesearchaeota archaeon]|nr:hypothetical protein [Candidatus Woesearchaeota archaeon]
MALHDGYYQGILQLRDPADEVVDFIIKNLRDKKDVQVSKVVKVRGGIDFYITNNKSLQKLGKKLILRFGGELKTSPKLFSRNRQTSKDIYRLNVYFRPSELKKDDFITYKNQVYKIVSLSKKMNVKELLSNKNSVIKYDSEIKKVEPIYKTIVSKVKPVIEILDPETYQSTPVKNSKDVKMGEKVKVIKVSREFWLV